MNLKQALAQARRVLEDNGIEDSGLEGEILLRHVLKMPRAEFFSSLDKPLAAGEKEKLSNLIELRCAGEPSAYIIGYREFFGLDFKTDRRVLIPRPETELIVEKALDYSRRFGYRKIADIGTGSGCIAVSLALNIPEAVLYAVDTSLPALEVAEENSIKHNVKQHIHFLWGNLLEPLPGPVDLIVANLPYVKTGEITSVFEPRRALDGGSDGLDKIKELIGQLEGKLDSRGALLLEVGQGQDESVKDNLHNLYPLAAIDVTRDLAGIGRVVSIRLTS